MRNCFSLPSFLEKQIKGNEMPDSYEKDAAFAEKMFDSLPVESVALTAPDGAMLKGLVLTPLQPNGKLILACHGARSSGKGEFCFFAADFYKKGYTLILPDHRGCGDSSGSFMGYGTHESTDTFLWLDYAKERFPSMDIFLLGVSMGAATVLMMSNREQIKDVRGIIADCSYTSAWDEFSYQLKTSFHLPDFPVLYLCDRFNRHFHHYSFKDASPLKCVKYAKVPILFIHGSRDDYVPLYMQELLYEACPTEKYRLTVPGAVHARSYYTDPVLYAKATEVFIRQCLQPKNYFYELQ